MPTSKTFAYAMLFALLTIAPTCALAQNRVGSPRGDLPEPSRSVPDGATGVDALSGTYRLVSGEADVGRAVNAVCDRLDFVTRAFARPILEDRNRPYSRVELALDHDTALFTLGPWGPVRTRFGVPRAIRNERGEVVRVHQRIVGGGRLVQIFTTDQGTRRNIWTASRDGRRVTVETLITSPRLPIPLRYRLVFEREP